MGLKYFYFIFHGLAHLLLVGLIFLAFQLNSLQLLLVLLASAAVDADHLLFIKKRGVGQWVRLWSSHTIKPYPLHNFLALTVFLIASIFVLDPELYIVGICSLSVALHLLWDLIEDVLIFKMGIKHWKI